MSACFFCALFYSQTLLRGSSRLMFSLCRTKRALLQRMIILLQNVVNTAAPLSLQARGTPSTPLSIRSRLELAVSHLVIKTMRKNVSSGCQAY